MAITNKPTRNYVHDDRFPPGAHARDDDRLAVGAHVQIMLEPFDEDDPPRGTHGRIVNFDVCPSATIYWVHPTGWTGLISAFGSDLLPL